MYIETLLCVTVITTNYVRCVGLHCNNGLYNWDGMCSLRGMDWDIIHN